MSSRYRYHPETVLQKEVTFITGFGAHHVAADWRFWMKKTTMSTGLRAELPAISGFCTIFRFGWRLRHSVLLFIFISLLYLLPAAFCCLFCSFLLFCCFIVLVGRCIAVDVVIFSDLCTSFADVHLPAAAAAGDQAFMRGGTMFCLLVKADQFILMFWA